LIIVFDPKDGWHAVVNLGDQRVRRRCQDRAALDDSVVRTAPTVPQSCERKNGTIQRSKTVRLLSFRCDFLPVVESVCWNKATTEPKCISERWLLGSRFRHCVDGPESNRRLFRPTRNQTPAHQAQYASWFRRILPHSRNHLRRGNVPARRPGDVDIQAKMVPQIALFRRESVPSAHKNLVYQGLPLACLAYRLEPDARQSPTSKIWNRGRLSWFLTITFQCHAHRFATTERKTRSIQRKRSDHNPPPATTRYYWIPHIPSKPE